MESIKQVVLDFIRSNGPILPAHAAKKIERDLMQTGAILSDLLSGKYIKISKAKIGGSPVYYFSGQEGKLDMLYEYLPGKEKEAYNLLKEKNVVKDREVGAGIRVAFRNLKDFAIPFKFNEEIYWRWYLLPFDEAGNYLPKIKQPERTQVEKPKLEKKSVKKNEFFDEVVKYLGENNVNVVREEMNKRTEVNFIASINSDIGKLNFLVVGRAKKKINDSDLTLAYSKGHKLKMPVIFLSSGSLTKKAEKYLEENKGYVVFKSMNS